MYDDKINELMELLEKNYYARKKNGEVVMASRNGGALQPLPDVEKFRQFMCLARDVLFLCGDESTVDKKLIPFFFELEWRGGADAVVKSALIDDLINNRINNEYLKVSDGDKDYYYYYSDGSLDDFWLFFDNRKNDLSDMVDAMSRTTFVRYHGKEKDIVIPKESKGITILEIGLYAFQKAEIDSIIIQDNITKIGNGAFAKSTVKSVTMADSVETIGMRVFWDCTKLSHIKLSNNLKSIPKEAFMDCTNLKELVLPESLTKIGDSAFYRCSNLGELVLPEGVKTIYNHAFEKSGLKKLVVSNNLKEIKGYVFFGCPKSLVIHGPKGSYAERYAKEHGVKFEYT